MCGIILKSDSYLILHSAADLSDSDCSRAPNLNDERTKTEVQIFLQLPHHPRISIINIVQISRALVSQLSPARAEAYLHHIFPFSLRLFLWLHIIQKKLDSHRSLLAKELCISGFLSVSAHIQT